MFRLNEDNRYLVCLQGVDLRKGVNGLCGVIRYLSLNPTIGDVYVFLNKNGTTIKLVVHWERRGFEIYYKHLERDRISHKIFIKEGVEFRSIRWDELILFIEGISPKIKRRKHYSLQ